MQGPKLTQCCGLALPPAVCCGTGRLSSVYYAAFITSRLKSPMQGKVYTPDTNPWIKSYMWPLTYRCDLDLGSRDLPGSWVWHTVSQWWSLLPCYVKILHGSLTFNLYGDLVLAHNTLSHNGDHFCQVMSRQVKVILRTWLWTWPLSLTLTLDLGT